MRLLQELDVLFALSYRFQWLYFGSDVVWILGAIFNEVILLLEFFIPLYKLELCWLTVIVSLILVLVGILRALLLILIRAFGVDLMIEDNVSRSNFFLPRYELLLMFLLYLWLSCSSLTILVWTLGGSADFEISRLTSVGSETGLVFTLVRGTKMPFKNLLLLCDLMFQVLLLSKQLFNHTR